MTAPSPSVDRDAADGREPATYVALDLGTNNCRLLMAHPAAEGFRVIDAFSRIVRLGEGLAATGMLSEAAMARTIEALKVCARKVAQRPVAGARYVATEACRRAGNCGVFVERIKAATGIAMEIISSDEEARLVVAGCAPLLKREPPHALVFDIGGGSTELVWLTLADGAQVIEDFISIPQGVVTFADRYGGKDVSRETYAAMVAEMRGALAPFEARLGIAARIAQGAVQLLGSSGTVTMLTALHLELPRYIRARVDGAILDFPTIAQATARLIAMPYHARAAHPCIGRERADLVVAGCAILEAICALWPVGRLAVADRGIREGILMSLVNGRG
ncbi:MAG TPA: Ppx/GppA phosphatase family protein [Stellaceae bacterium]|nr:Ppx/GppA phosphatase family protein [Stellaceae bacterium]